MCSDALPADAVNRARDEISVKSGLRTAEVERALTDEERAQAAEEEVQRKVDQATADTRPVSYTHLDVYKRQAQRRAHFIRLALAVDRHAAVALLGAGVLEPCLLYTSRCV